MLLSTLSSLLIYLPRWGPSKSSQNKKFPCPGLSAMRRPLFWIQIEADDIWNEADNFSEVHRTQCAGDAGRYFWEPGRCLEMIEEGGRWGTEPGDRVLNSLSPYPQRQIVILNMIHRSSDKLSCNTSSSIFCHPLIDFLLELVSSSSLQNWWRLVSKDKQPIIPLCFYCILYIVSWLV